MPDELCVALAQLAPAMRDVARNAATMQQVVEDHPEADLVVFPELFIGGYTATNVASSAIVIDDERLQSLADSARRLGTALIFGAAVARPDGFTNTAVVIDSDGQWIESYDKAYLFEDESEAYVPGDQLKLVEIGGVRVGLMICFDMEFPEVARALCRAGADMLVTISANMTPFDWDHRLFGLVRAVENGCLHAYVNQIGPGEHHHFNGGSMLVSPDGEPLVDAGSSDTGVLTAHVTAPMHSESRPAYLAERREHPLPVCGPTDRGPTA